MTQEDTPTRQSTHEVRDFAEIEDEFLRRVAKTVWCTMATVDTKGRPRTRIIHPIWEPGARGWIATGRNSLKAKHLAGNPWVSFTYWDQNHEQIYVEAKAEWEDDPAEKQRIWDLYKNTPPPLGYDPGMIPGWEKGPNIPEFGLLKLTPWRIELFGLTDMISGNPPRVWRP